MINSIRRICCAIYGCWFALLNAVLADPHIILFETKDPYAKWVRNIAVIKLRIQCLFRS